MASVAVVAAGSAGLPAVVVAAVAAPAAGSGRCGNSAGLPVVASGRFAVVAVV